MLFSILPAKLQKKNDIHNSVCHFSRFFFFLLAYTATSAKT